MLPLFFSCLLALAAAQSGTLLVLDTGVGHRSTPIPRWHTSLRSLTASGTNASILQSFGTGSIPAEPINAYSLAYTNITKSAYLATGQGIIRADLDTGHHEIIVPNEQGDSITSVTISPTEAKLYFSTLTTGLIKSANLNGYNIQIIHNASQGLDFSLPAFTPANSHAAGLLPDPDKNWLYWSASRGPDSGSIRRIPLHGPGPEQILATGLNMPAQLRLVRDTTTQTNALWWAEKARDSSSPLALRLLDLYKFAELPSSRPLPPPSVSPVLTMIHSDDHSLFRAVDAAGETQTLGIQSFVVYRDGVTQRVWFVIMSAGRSVFGKLVEMTWQGSGGGRRPVLKVFNQDTRDLGVPVGLEYVP
ncbi:hypothetical protein J1614_002157 [Plenodomus biglobosus]|nr:hypothetical protein J1614_002157 [Plenodomus biglobosus]